MKEDVFIPGERAKILGAIITGLEETIRNCRFYTARHAAQEIALTPEEVMFINATNHVSTQWLAEAKADTLHIENQDLRIKLRDFANSVAIEFIKIAGKYGSPAMIKDGHDSRSVH